MNHKYKRLRTAAISIGLAMVFAPAIASDWREVTSTDSRVISVDTQSIQNDGKYQKAWFIANLNKPDTVPDSLGLLYSSYKYLVYFSCKDKTISSAAIYFFPESDGKGAFVGSSTTKSNFIDIMPDSANEAMLKFVCGTLRIKQS